MTIQNVVTGSWFMIADKPQCLTPTLPEEINSILESLRGLQLTKEILYQFGFINFNDDYVSFELYPAAFGKNIESGLIEMIRPCTRLCVESNDFKRKSVFIQIGESKIYLSEISFVHELQNLVFGLTQKYPSIKNLEV